MKINRTREAKWAARVQRISITLSIIFGFLINCERPHGAQRHTRSPATHGLLLLTLLHAINHASHEKLREPVATDPRRSIPPPLPPVRGGKSHHSFAPFTFPAAFAFYRIQECKSGFVNISKVRVSARKN